MMDDEFGALVEDKDIPYSVQLQLIKKRTERGMSPLQIARLMGLKKAIVERVVSEYNWTAKRKVNEERKEAQKTKAQLERERLTEIIRELAQRGMTHQEVADIISKPLEYVKNIGYQYGVKFKFPERQALYKSVELYKKLKKLEKLGMTRKQMGVKVGTSEQTVRNCFSFFEKGAKP